MRLHKPCHFAAAPPAIHSRAGWRGRPIGLNRLFRGRIILCLNRSTDQLRTHRKSLQNASSASCRDLFKVSSKSTQRPRSISRLIIHGYTPVALRCFRLRQSPMPKPTIAGAIAGVGTAVVTPERMTLSTCQVPSVSGIKSVETEKDCSCDIIQCQSLGDGFPSGIGKIPSRGENT
jgi:hypothetical protein